MDLHVVPILIPPPTSLPTPVWFLKTPPGIYLVQSPGSFGELSISDAVVVEPLAGGWGRMHAP